MQKLKGLILKALKWVLSNAYEVALSITCFLVAIHVLGTWACWAVLFVSFGVWAYKKTKS